MKHPSSTLVQYKEVNVIFESSHMEGIITKERTIYVNEAQNDNYPAIVTRSPTSPGRPVSFSEEDAIMCTSRRLGCDDIRWMLQSVEDLD